MKITPEKNSISKGLVTIILVLAISGSANIYAIDSNEPAKQKTNNIIAEEQEMQIESWMKDLSSWPLHTKHNVYLNHKEPVKHLPGHFQFIANEDRVRLEKWMLNPNDPFWSEDNLVVENAIDLEDWMLDYTLWTD